METYFIHVRDPHFADPPWPGLRRLGPYGDREQADLQADHDRELGVDIVGVFPASESEALKGEAV